MAICLCFPVVGSFVLLYDPAICTYICMYVPRFSGCAYILCCVVGMQM